MVNPRPSGPRAQLSLYRMLALLVLPAVFFLTCPVMAQTGANCDRAGCGTIRNGSVITCFTPATSPPSSLWDQLQPAVTGTLPTERDTTNFNEVYQNYSDRNWFEGVEVQNGWILAGLAHGIGVWDARSDPANPAFVAAQRYPSGLSFPSLPTGEQSKIVFGAIAAPDDTVAAVSGYNGVGILVFDLSDKSHPRPVYQNADKTGDSIYAAKLGGTRYVFMAASSPGGLFLYNLDKALTFTGGCLEDDSTPGHCPGVLVNQIPTAVAAANSVHGVGNYVAVSFSGSRGFQIFDVSDPLHPVSKFVGLRDRPVQGIAMWNQGSSYYLAARLGATISAPLDQTAIYDVSCITGANGCSAITTLSIGNLDTQSSAEYLTFSRSGSTPFLYVGGDASCLGLDGRQREWLLNVSNPAIAMAKDPTNPSAPFMDVTPQSTTQVSAPYNGVNTTLSVNYWSYFYRESPTGFNLVAPRAGKFYGSYFYRAARSIFDIHKWVHDVAPTADFIYSPTEIYPGTPVTFTDRSSGVPTSLSWTFQGGTPPSASSSTAGSSVAVTFATTGSKSVSLTAGNGQGSGSVTKNVLVLDPTPQGGITASADSVTVCQPVTFTAAVTGAPPLTFSWEVLNPNSGDVQPPASGGSTFTWTSPSSLAPGTYTGKVTVKNSFVAAGVALTKTVQVLALPALTDISALTPSATFTTNVVQFQAPAHQGATSWVWDYGDGKTDTFTDPAQGPNPTHLYANVGQYSAKVTISNCVNQTGFTSQAKTVNITVTTPLVASFQASVFCQFQQCFADVAQSIPFADSSTGAELWDYDWNHADASAQTCNFTDAGHAAPVPAHTYTSAGVYFPCLRVRRGASEQNVVVHGSITVSLTSGGGGGGGGGTNPTISVGGSPSTTLNQAITLSAGGVNCTPSSTGWSWATSGGTIAGANNGSTVSVSWATAGSKLITVTNSGCSGAQGTFNVNVTDPNGGGGTGGGGGTLQAQFNFLPASPQPGDVVSFDASSSTGSPTDYSWSFGDGTSGTGVKPTHAYAAAGSYVAQLSISKPSTGCPFAPCIATSTANRTVVVAGTPPPPPVSAEFTTTATCINVGGFDQCQGTTGQAVTLSATVTDGASYQWNFGDGTTGSGALVNHTWAQPNSYFVALTVTKGTATATKSRTFVISGTPPPPPPSVKSVVLPWIAQTRGALVQSSDLYVHNPSTNPISVTLEFRKRGLPESNPPRVSKTIAPGATLYVADVLRQMFNRENVAGFVSLVVDQGDTAPIITSYNTTVQADGKQFGQTISGISMSTTGSAASSDPVIPIQNLVGLISNSDRLAYFGVSNPSAATTTYHLRLFDKTGKLIGESSQDLTVSSFGQRQFQAAEIQSTFGVSNDDDYRVEVQTKTGGTLLPYASNLRLASSDPSFIEAGSSKNAKSYLLGVLSAPGANNSLWRSDLLLSNIGTQISTADVTFTGLGLNALPTKPLHVTLQPGETQRLADVVAGQLGVQNGIGVLTVNSSSPEGVFPIVQGESYDNSNPAKRFGQSMAAITDADAAGSGQSHYLVGLRQDAGHRTTFWLFNPDSSNAQYDIFYRGLDGTVIGSTKGVVLGAGKLRQFSPNQLPLPAAGVQDGFTIQIVVKGGKVLSAAQVVNNATNDPSYIRGEVR